MRMEKPLVGVEHLFVMLFSPLSVYVLVRQNVGEFLSIFALVS